MPQKLRAQAAAAVASIPGWRRHHGFYEYSQAQPDSVSQPIVAGPVRPVLDAEEDGDKDMRCDEQQPRERGI